MTIPTFKLKQIFSVAESVDTNYFKELRVLVMVLLILALLLSSLVILVGYFLYQEGTYILPLFSMKTVSTLPVLCEDLSLSPNEDFDTFDVTKENLRVYRNAQDKYICDGKNFTGVVNKIVERQSRILLAKGLVSDRYISCGNRSLKRKTGSQTVSFLRISQHQNYPENNFGATVHWDKHEEQSYMDPDIYYHNGEITIPEGQTYFVYASVHVKISLGLRQRKRYATGRQHYTLRICRKSFDYEETLLSKTLLFSDNKGSMKSSLRVEGPLQLKKKDIIYLKVSDGNQLIHNSSGNTFGLFPL